MESSTKKLFTVLASVMLVVALVGLIFSVFPGIRNVGNNTTSACSHEVEYVEAKAVTCTEDGWTKYAYCVKCGYSNRKLEKATGHNFELDYGITTCNTCGVTFDPETRYIFDHGNTDGMTGVYGTSSNFNTTANSELPLVVEGDYYSFIKKSVTSERKQAQLWIPKEASGISGFSSDNDAVGIFTSRLNVNVDYSFELILVEGISANRWGSDWCISDPVFKIIPVIDSSGTTYYKFYGIYDELLYMCKADDTGFTGWFDLHIGIDMNSDDDTVSFSYYVNGKLCGTLSAELTTVDNSITSVYMSIKTKEINSGVMFDDLVFGYSKNGTWEF